jgi:hypothetical protein
VAYADAPRFATAHRKISRRIMFRDSSRLQGGIPTMREDGGKRGEGKQVRNFHFHCWAFAQLIGMCVVPATLQEYSLALRGRCGITGSLGA